MRRRGVVCSYQGVSPEKKADTAALSRSGCRRSGALAVEWEVQGEASGSGECVRVLGEASGDVGLPESSPERRRTVAVFERNSIAWGRVRVRRLGETEEEMLALKKARFLSGITAAIK